jgi:hypothetical protein
MVSSCGQAHITDFASFIQPAEKYFLCTKHGSFNPRTLPPPEKIDLRKKQPGCRTSPMTFGSVMNDRYISETTGLTVMEKSVIKGY